MKLVRWLTVMDFKGMQDDGLADNDILDFMQVVDVYVVEDDIDPAMTNIIKQVEEIIDQSNLLWYKNDEHQGTWNLVALGEESKPIAYAVITEAKFFKAG